MLHVFLVLSVVQGARIHTDGVLEGISEEHFVEVAVETESIYGAVLMKSGNIDADDILVLYKACYSASDLTNVLGRKSVCVEDCVDNNSVIRTVAYGKNSYSQIIKDFGGMLGIGVGEASADIVISVKLVACE